MADAKAVFVAELKDDMSAPSNAAREALQKLAGQLDRDKKALGQLQGAMKSMNASSVVNIETFKKMQAEAKTLQERIGSNQGVFFELGGSLEMFKKKGGAAGESAMSFRDRLAKVPGPIGDTVRKLGDLSTASGGASIAMIGLVGGVALLGVGVLVGIASLAKFAFSHAVMAREAKGARGEIAGLHDAAAAGLPTGPVVGFTRQIANMKRDFGRLFGGINITPILRGMSMITGMFAANTQSGMAMRELLADMFNPLASAAGGVFPTIRHFFTGLIVGALEIETTILQLQTAWYRAFGPEVQGHVSNTTQALSAGKLAMYGIAAVVGVLAAGVAVLAAPFVLLGRTLWNLAPAFDAMMSSGRRAISALGRFGEQLADDWADIGPRLIDGLVNGITGGIGRAATAIRGLGSGMVTALKGALGIHSPSRVFAELGIQIPRGVEVGIDQGADRMNAAVERVVQVPTGLEATGPDQVRDLAPAARSGATFNFGDIIVQTSATTPAGFAEAIRDKLAEILEGVGTQMGAPA